MRKIIQIQLTPTGKIVALADDGSLWIKESEWFRIKPLPEYDVDEADGSV